MRPAARRKAATVSAGALRGAGGHLLGRQSQPLRRKASCWSKRAVYSTRAASPRAATSAAMIAATASSTSASVSASRREAPRRRLPAPGSHVVRVDRHLVPQAGAAAGTLPSLPPRLPGETPRSSSRRHPAASSRAVRLTIRRDVTSAMCSISTRPLARRVEPVCTRSTICRHSPMIGSQFDGADVQKFDDFGLDAARGANGGASPLDICWRRGCGSRCAGSSWPIQSLGAATIIRQCPISRSSGA